MSHVAIYNWIDKFVDVVKPYLDSISPPKLSGIYHVDEMVVNVRGEKMDKGHYQWLWNLMDSTTRFWICSRLSQRRDTQAGVELLQEAKKRAPLPKAFIHDGLRTYDEAYQKEYFTLKTPRI
jgi:transposase-like protein